MLLKYKKILTFFAHPDDETLAVGATINKLTKKGCRVYVAIPATGVHSRRNNQEKKIAMTAPVITQMKSAQSHIVHFVMPSEYNLESLPDPNLQSVKIEEEKLGVIAAMRFGGWATEKKSNRYIQIFLNQLKEKDIQIIGDIRVAQYNGPTTIPPFRKNEILIPVSYK